MRFIVLMALALAACASRPVALVALPAPVAPADRDAGPGTSVLVRQVELPDYLDGFPVVVSRDGSGLMVSTDTEWAERPSDGVSRVLRDALSQRLDPSRVVIDRGGRLPDVDLAVEFLALEPSAGALHLDARWYFSCTAGRGGQGGRTQLEVPLGAKTPAAVASATTESLTRFADVLARAVPSDCRPNAGDVARRRSDRRSRQNADRSATTSRVARNNVLA